MSLRKLIKKILPERFKELYFNRKKNIYYLKLTHALSKGTLGLRKAIFHFFSFTRIGSSLYYFLLSNTFRREHQRVLKGKLKYLKSVKNPEFSQYLLRRNTHRLEKGLLMKPRRSVFALDYISETVEAFKKLLDLRDEHPSVIDNGQVKWSHDVLKKYFEVVSPHEIINRAKNNFEMIEIQHNEISTPKYIPYNRLLEEKRSNIPTFNQIRELSEFRRSVRWFNDKKVPRKLVDQAIEVASYAPSACNRQPFEFRIIDDSDLLQQVVKLPKGTGGYYQNIPMMIVVIGKLDAYFSERDRHLIYIDSSLASMSLVFAFETLGLSSCCINWADIEYLERRMENVLDLQSHERPIMCMAVGYPDEDGKVAYSKKKPLDQLRRFN